MWAAVVTEAGAPPEVVERDAPAAGENQTVVEVRAASINPVDLHIAGGRFFSGPPQVPYVPGVEGVGTVAGANRKRVRFEQTPFNSQARQWVVDLSQKSGIGIALKE